MNLAINAKLHGRQAPEDPGVGITHEGLAILGNRSLAGKFQRFRLNVDPRDATDAPTEISQLAGSFPVDAIPLGHALQDCCPLLTIEA